jgi:hypothetical protein
MDVDAQEGMDGQMGPEDLDEEWDFELKVRCIRLSSSA